MKLTYDALPEGFREVPGEVYRDYFINKDGVVLKKHGPVYTVEPESIDADGIRVVTIKQYCYCVTKKIAYLILKTFIPNPSGTTRWFTVDGNYNNISLDNLKWNVKSYILPSLPSDAKPTCAKNVYIDKTPVVYTVLEDGRVKCFRSFNKYRHGKKMTYMITVNKSTYTIVRLLASAFIPCPGDMKHMIAITKDDNSLNLDISNIIWIPKKGSRPESVKHIAKEKRTKCPICNERIIYGELKVCRICTNNKLREERKKNKADYYKSLQSHPYFEYLSAKQRASINLLASGKTIVEAASELKVTRQCVSCSVNHAVSNLNSERFKKKAGRMLDTSLCYGS